MTKIIYSVVFIAFSALPLIISYFLKKQYRKRIDELKTESDYYNQCIFIDMKNFKCRDHLINREECSEHCSYAELQTLVNMALIMAHQRGINVRVITDKVMVKTDVSKFNFSKLTEKGIPYKVQPSQHNMMHHKFCIIDKEDRENARLFFGSLNMTGQGLVSNFDSVILTNNSDTIKAFSEEFEELWEDFNFE